MVKVNDEYQDQYRVRDCILIRATEEKLLHFINHDDLHTVGQLGPKFGYSTGNELRQFEQVLKKVCHKKLTFKVKRGTVELRPDYAKTLESCKRRRLS